MTEHIITLSTYYTRAEMDAITDGTSFDVDDVDFISGEFDDGRVARITLHGDMDGEKGFYEVELWYGDSLLETSGCVTGRMPSRMEIVSGGELYRVKVKFASA